MAYAFACGTDSAERSNADANAATLWETLQTADYRVWARAPGYPARTKSSAPHGSEVDIYINDVVLEALAGDGRLAEWPKGTLIVKDGFEQGNAGATPDIVAVMQKSDDDWFWAEYFAGEGSARYSGAPAICTGCHSSGSDFVRAFALP